MDEHALKSVLRKLHFSAAFPDEVIHEFAEIASSREVSDSEVLFREGDLHEYLYLVSAGKIALEMRVPGRGKVCLLTVGPGEFVGWSGFLQQTTMTATAIALQESQLIATPTKELNALCEANPSFGLHLTKRVAQALSRRLIATRLQLLDLFGDNPLAPPANDPQLGQY